MPIYGQRDDLQFLEWLTDRLIEKGEHPQVTKRVMRVARSLRRLREGQPPQEGQPNGSTRNLADMDCCYKCGRVLARSS